MMLPRLSPSVVQLTPPGRGAVATLLIEGPGALAVAQASFRTKSGASPKDWTNRRPRFGYFQTDAGVCEEVVLSCGSEDSVELHCHGGRAAVAGIEQLFAGCGCRVLDWRNWVRQHEDDPIRAAARLALADARTERTAAILLDQYQGVLGHELESVRGALEAGDRGTARARLDRLLAQAELGRHLVEPWRIVLAGQPNVGKSSLLNALVGYGRAIVHHVPGTTRDVVTVASAIDGWPVELRDTAGLRKTNQAIEREGVRRAEECVVDADLIVLVFDASQPWSATQSDYLGRWPDALVVHNKSDLPPSPEPRPSGLTTSALLGEGIDSLVHAMAVRLVPDPPQPGAAVPFTVEQIDTLRRVAEASEQTRFQNAIHLLTALCTRSQDPG